jgi:hypothetical protein
MGRDPGRELTVRPVALKPRPRPAEPMTRPPGSGPSHPGAAQTPPLQRPAAGVQQPSALGSPSYSWQPDCTGVDCMDSTCARWRPNPPLLEAPGRWQAEDRILQNSLERPWTRSFP